MQVEWLVLFDIDGTLLNSGGSGRAATRLALEEVFGTPGAAETISFAGKTDWQIALEALEPAGVSRDEIEARLPAYNEVVTRHLTAIIDRFPVRACPGTHALVDALKARGDVLLGLVTGNMTGLIPLKLRQTWDIRPTATLHLFGVDDPTDRVKVHLWGTDDLGGDVFGKVLFGARISLTIGILASLVAIAIGMLMGGLAGFYGGWLDELILRLVEAIDAIPSLFLLLTLSAVFYPLGLPSSVVFPLIVVVLSLIGWGGVARTIRAQVLSLKERDFAVAAKAAGASNWRIIRAHLLPQTLSYVIVVMSLAIPGFILTEAVLSFFGLGIQPPATSWGLMLNTAQSFVGVSGLGDRWWIFIPGIFIFVSVLTWNLLGDGLRDAFDPRSRR